MPTRADRRIRALQVARDCARLGARVRTLQHLTRLPHGELLRLCFADPMQVPRGRPPHSPDWYHNANVLFRAEASLVCALYHRLRTGGFAPADSLVAAYRHYRRACAGQARISFDRAFDLAAHLDGIWIARSPHFDMVACLDCRSLHLAAAGSAPLQQGECPFCKLLARYRTDPRVQATFPLRPLPDPASVPAGVLRLLQPRRTGDDAESPTSSCP